MYSADLQQARVFGDSVYVYPSHNILATPRHGRIGWFYMEDYHDLDVTSVYSIASNVVYINVVNRRQDKAITANIQSTSGTLTARARQTLLTAIRLQHRSPSVKRRCINR